MVAERIFPAVGSFEVAGAGVFLPASELAFDGLVWGTAEEYGDAHLERLPCFSACSRCHADCSAHLNYGVPLLL